MIECLMVAASRRLVPVMGVVLLTSCATPLLPETSVAELFRRYEDSIFLFTEKGTYTVELIPLPDPPRVGENNARLLVRDFTARDIGDASVTLRALMPETGHTPLIAPDMEDTGTGTYHIREIMLDRPGRWAYDIRIEKDGVADGVRVLLPLVQR